MQMVLVQFACQVRQCACYVSLNVSLIFSSAVSCTCCDSCRLLRLVVAMESALADGRYEEAAHLRDEYRKALLDQSREERADSTTTESSTADQRKLL